eukprot:12896765-Prorocentrum_lima.AAC.1
MLYWESFHPMQLFFHLEVLQVWNAYDGRNSQKKGWPSTKVGDQPTMCWTSGCGMADLRSTLSSH